MLTHPTHEALSALRLDGMAEAFAELVTQDRGRSLDPVAWIGLMLDREQARRGTRRFQSRLRAANLRHGNACMEDVDYRTSRGLDRALFQSLGSAEWLDRHRSVLITGPCGVGKSWLACALGHAASRADRTVLYHRLPRLFADLELARGDGRFDRLFRKLARVDRNRPAWPLSAPAPGEQLVHFGDLVIRDSGQGVGEPGVGIDAV